MPKISSILKAVVEKDREFLLDAPEVVIFSACHGIIQRVLTLEWVFKAGRIDEAEFSHRINNLLWQLTRMAEATQRFDIVLPVTEFGRFSPSFWRWFNWWNDYRKSLTPTKINHLERLAQERATALNHHRPMGDWLRYRQTPAIKLEIS